MRAHLISSPELVHAWLGSGCSLEWVWLLSEGVLGRRTSSFLVVDQTVQVDQGRVLSQQVLHSALGLSSVVLKEVCRSVVTGECSSLTWPLFCPRSGRGSRPPMSQGFAGPGFAPPPKPPLLLAGPAPNAAMTSCGSPVPPAGEKGSAVT